MSEVSRAAAAIATWLASTVVAVLAGCGGGASDPGSPHGATAASQIRFAGHYAAGCSGCTPSSQPSLTIAPVTGAAALGSRDIARIEIRADGGAAQVLTASNGVDASGRPLYRFDLPPLAPQPLPSGTRGCAPEQSLQITVIDVSDFAFTKYHGACHDADFGAFSDYGTRDVVFAVNAAASAPVQLMRTSAADPGYVDKVSRTAGPATSWTVRAAEGDLLYAFGGDLQGLPTGTPLSVTISTPAGGSATTTVLAQATGTDLVTFLKCCTGSSSQAATPRDLAVVAYTARYGVPLGANDPPDRYDLRYRLTDASTGAVAAEFNGTATGYASWPLRALPGQVLSVDATPQQAGTYLYLSIADNSAGSTGDAFGTQRSMGLAHSNRRDAPARLTVVCCAP